MVLFCLATVGKIGWFDNWVSFMDNMLQMRILSEDTRSLLAPVSLDSLVIDVKKHNLVLQTLSKENSGKKYLYTFKYFNYKVKIFRDSCLFLPGYRPYTIWWH